MNNYQRLNLLAAIVTQATLVTHTLGGAPAMANSDEALLQLCSSFPHNSRCEGKKVPISLKKRDGEKAKCLLSGAEKAKKCKVLLRGKTLSAYFESGERLKVLDNAKNTTELKIPLSTIKSFEYSENSKTNVTAVVMLGLPGLLFKKKTANFNIQHTSEAIEKADLGRQEHESVESTTETKAKKVKIVTDDRTRVNVKVATDDRTQLNVTKAEKDETRLKEQSSPQLLFSIQRDHGREMRQQLEKGTGLAAELNSIDE